MKKYIFIILIIINLTYIQVLANNEELKISTNKTNLELNETFQIKLELNINGNGGELINPELQINNLGSELIVVGDMSSTNMMINGNNFKQGFTRIFNIKANKIGNYQIKGVAKIGNKLIGSKEIKIKVNKNLEKTNNQTNQNNNENNGFEPNTNYESDYESEKKISFVDYIIYLLLFLILIITLKIIFQNKSKKEEYKLINKQNEIDNIKTSDIEIMFLNKMKELNIISDNENIGIEEIITKYTNQYGENTNIKTIGEYINRKKFGGYLDLEPEEDMKKVINLGHNE